MDTPILKRILAMLALTAFLAVLVLIPAYLYADSLYREVFDARIVHPQTQEMAVTFFDLQAQESEHQMQSRIAGWLSTVSSQEVVVFSQRGRLSATLFEPIGGAVDAPWAVVFHGGLGTDREQVKDVACMLSLQGYRVLTPDLFAHGKSAGDASTLGFGDAQDVRAWVDYIEKAQMDARIVLFGQDEGAAAVLTAACEGLSDSVAAVAADSACDDGVSRLLELADAKTDGLRSTLMRLMFFKRTGGDDQKISVRIAQADVPLLLIHGTGDQIVPAWRSEDIVHAAGDKAQLLFIEGAGHGLSRFVDQQTYYENLFSFFEYAL